MTQTKAGIHIEDLHLSFGETKVLEGIDMAIEPGEFFAFLGPSGSGKSTLLRAIAGFGPTPRGRILIGGRDIASLPPWKRNVGMVFQSYALWPHMSVRKNVAFGLEERRVPKREIAPKVERALETVGLLHLADRMPAQLSGGQQQRVALARALVKQSDIFLLDEPLSNLDALLRVHARKNLLEIHNAFRHTMIYVTHDQIEAMTLGHRIALLYKGDLQMIGTPTELYHRPVNLFSASFIGTPPMNLFDVHLDGTELCLGPHRLPLTEAWLNYLSDRDFDELVLGIRAERLRISDEVSPYSIPVSVDYTENYGNQLGIHFHLNGDVGVALSDHTQPKQIRVRFEPDYFHFFNKTTTKNLGYPQYIEDLRAKEYA